MGCKSASRSARLTNQDVNLVKVRDPDSFEVVGLDLHLVLCHFKGYQEGGNRTRLRYVD